MVITPTTEVTTETHFTASATLLTPYLSFSAGLICLTVFFQNPLHGFRHIAHAVVWRQLLFPADDN